VRLRHSLRTSTLIVAAAGLLAAGCSSGHPSARESTSTTVGPSAVTPKQAANSLGRQMLDDAVLPAGARPSRAPAPNLLNEPGSVPAIGNLVYGHRLWTVNEDPRAVYRWLQVRGLRGFGRSMTSTGSNGGVPIWGVEFDLASNPPNITEAALEYGIISDASGHAVVRVDSVVGWAQPRPANEVVGAADKFVIVTVVHIDGSIGKRVVVTDPKVVQPIVRAFNQLRVSPPEGPHGCPPMGEHTVSYQVAFATSATAPPDVVASIGKCGNIGVTVKGRPAPGLGDFVNAGFGDAVAHVLGLSEPHFG